jgi:Dynamin family/Dynamin central region
MDGLKLEQLQSLQSKDQAALLDTVDEIRHHGVNRYVSLPQLIVCGDQSSGKSSVLEAISGVQFPVNDGLCTRFTTEVILRRATQSLATVKLIPSKDAPASHKEKLSLFEKSSINHSEIPDLISEAKTFMGLTGSSTFSRDVLQLEVSGPKLPHLTLVDLPGLIHHPNKEQTEEDVRIPKELVQKYMSQSRSIVLAIITAKNDTSNQVVLEMAKAADPQGNRTMGIITKPDCLIKDSPNESNFFALASNKETYFKLDWHVLRNGDFNERKDSTFDRDAVEKDFFASTIWKSLPSHKRGVEALRTRLSHVLYQQIQKELPSLIKEIEAELAACKTTLDRLGSPRDTPSSRRQYLTGIAGRFLDLVRAANDGTYQDSFFRPANFGYLGTAQMQKTRLRATVRKAEQKFLNRMHQYGHSYVIVPEGSKTKRVNPLYPPPSFVSAGVQTTIHEKQFLQEIRQLLNDSKGRELPGTFTPLLVGDLFIRQSTNWKPFALDFVEDVWDIVKQFLDDVLVHVADENVREALLEEIIDPEMDRILTKLKDKVAELHSPYARGSPKTLNPRFVKELESRRSQQADKPPHQPGTVLGTTITEDADAYACRELLHLMQAYYTVALDVFVDNVSSLAVENCLMIALENLLSPLTVSEMSDEELEDIAFESSDVRELRSQTLEKQSSLQKSFELCRRQARKLASNRLNEEAQKDAQKKTQKTEPLPTSVTEGVAKVKITPAASVATPIKVCA